MLKQNVFVRKQKKKDPILRRILANEDNGEDGEFFTVKILNADLETIKDGPLKHLIDVTDKLAEECQENKRTDRINYTHRNLNLQYK